MTGNRITVDLGCLVVDLDGIDEDDYDLWFWRARWYRRYLFAFMRPISVAGRVQTITDMYNRGLLDGVVHRPDDDNDPDMLD